jgi:DNA-binding transcriptional LysR family regulator
MQLMNLNDVDLNLLVALDAVFRDRNATLAATRLHVTQSAVSNALKRARALFDDPLVVRLGRGFALTPKAEALEPRVREILTAVQNVLSSDPTGEPDRWLTIACADAVGVALVPLILPLLRQRLPQVRLRTVTPDHVRVAGLERSDVDLVIGVLREVPPGSVSEDLFEDAMVVIAAASHPQVGSRLSLELYAQLPHAELALFGEPEDRVDRALASLGLRRRIDVMVPHLTALPFLVADSDRVATVIRSVARMFAAPLALQTFKPPVPLAPLVVRMVWHRRRAADPASLALRDVVRTAVRQLRRSQRRTRHPGG